MPSRRMLLIVNPRGGRRKGLKILEDVLPAFAAGGVVVDVRRTEFAGHAAELARTLDLDGYDGICSIGGDGTAHEVVNGLMQRESPARPPLGIIPAGTGNAVLWHLRATTPRLAVERIVAGRTLPLDLARLSWADRTAYSINVVGWGNMVDIGLTAERLRRLGPPRYALAAAAQILRARRRPLRLTLDDETIEDEFLLVAACNTRFVAAGMDLAPRAEMSDGLLDVVVVRRASRRQMWTLFRRIHDGSHVHLPWVEYRQVRRLRLETATADPLNIDGELAGETPVSIDVVPAAVQVFG